MLRKIGKNRNLTPCIYVGNPGSVTGAATAVSAEDTTDGSAIFEL